MAILLLQSAHVLSVFKYLPEIQSVFLNVRVADELPPTKLLAIDTQYTPSGPL